MAIVSAGYLPSEKFLQMMSLISIEEAGYMLLERPETTCFKKYSGEIDWAGWDFGRGFCVNFDLRWQKSEGVFHIVVISDEAPEYFSTRFQLDLEAERYDRRDTRWLLWGRKEEGDRWIERIVPQVLNYPIEAKEGSRVALSLIEYINPANSKVEFYRFTGLEEVRGA